MQLRFRTIVGTILAIGLAWSCPGLALPSRAQELPLDESAAKGRQLVQQVIATLGGPAYLNVRDSECLGKVAQFGAIGDSPNFTEFRDLWLLPDKNRTEYRTQGEHTILGFLMGAQGLLITHGGANVTVFNGSEGWALDRKGITPQPDDAITGFNEQVKSGMNNMLRKRMNEPGVDVRYAGPDLIDLKEAEWIEFTDSDHRVMRLGIEKYSHLPLRWVVSTRNPETRVTAEAMTSYTQYMMMDGVKTPLSIELYNNDHKLSQTFLSSCKYNSDIIPQLFTRASLEQLAAETAKKGKKDSKISK